MLGRTGVAHYGRRCSWAHSEGHIGVAHYGILVGGPLQLRWQPIGRRCLWAHLGEVPTTMVLTISGQNSEKTNCQLGLLPSPPHIIDKEITPSGDSRQKTTAHTIQIRT